MTQAFEYKLRRAAINLGHAPVGKSGTIIWQCPSNIALIKYWGKKSFQIPLNPSLSFALEISKTEIELEYHVVSDTSDAKLSFLFNDEPNAKFEERVKDYLDKVNDYLPFIRQVNMHIHSKNNFPHSTGIASSASAFASIALTLCSLENELFGTFSTYDDFLRKASFLARLGSGSASRSVYGGYSLWGKTPLFSESADEFAVQINHNVHPVYNTIHDAVLIVTQSEKKISSSLGHKLMENHPFAGARISQANQNLDKMVSVLKNGDIGAFIEISENEALTLHALIFCSNPGYILIHPNTIKIIERIYVYRKENNVTLGYTLDAGANVHLLYPASIKARVKQFIGSELNQYCENGQVIYDSVGKGPVKLE